MEALLIKAKTNLVYRTAEKFYTITKGAVGQRIDSNDSWHFSELENEISFQFKVGKKKYINLPESWILSKKKLFEELR